jgi:hypothetical protein
MQEVAIHALAKKKKKKKNGNQLSAAETHVQWSRASRKTSTTKINVRRTEKS